MQASETKLQKIIEGTNQYVIPLFQRPYSWKEREWQTLLDDIKELCSVDEPRPHFMGSIVTMPTTSFPEGVSKYLLIDGQQRLTTLFIFLAALRDHAKISDEELASEINNTILVNPYKKGDDYYKLQPTQVDRKAFYTIIKSEELIDGNGLTECYKFFIRKIRQTNFSLYKIKEIICGSLSLVSVLLSIEDDPYLVFESLNAKGRPLTQADLIRNYFFMQISSNKQDSVYQNYWEPMQKLLGENLTEFIRHYLTRSGIDVKQSEIYFEIKERISKGDALIYLQDLYKYSQYYIRILHPEKESNLKIRKYLARMNRLEVTTVYPFLLNCFDDWQYKRITEDEFISVLQIIENFLLRRFVCNIQTRGLNRIFAVLYSQVSKDTDLNVGNFVDKLKISLQNRDYPNDSDFCENLKNVKLYGSNRSEKARLILESIEESFNHKEQVSFDGLTIEHIMPQTINHSGWWQEHLGEDWAINHELFLHSLGNLTLTGYNAELCNADFLTKRNEYCKSHLELNKYFSTISSWRKEDIETRTEILVEKILTIWPYFGDNFSSESKNEKNKTVTKSPKTLKIFNQDFPVKSWRDVLEKTLNTIADLEPDKFNLIMEEFPRFVSWEQQNFRSNRQLKNGAFIEVNLSSKNIQKFCIKAIESADLSTDDWQVLTHE
jgi:uncharacterized protein with ParB-like and HNH nuclease domain